METQPPAEPRPRTKLSAEVKPQAAFRARSELTVEPDRVAATFDLPELGLAEVGHKLRNGVLLVWSKRADVPYHCMLPLPASLSANGYLVTARNGVVEFLFATAEAAQ